MWWTISKITKLSWTTFSHIQPIRSLISMLRALQRPLKFQPYAAVRRYGIAALPVALLGEFMAWLADSGRAVCCFSFWTFRSTRTTLEKPGEANVPETWRYLPSQRSSLPFHISLFSTSQQCSYMGFLYSDGFIVQRFLSFGLPIFVCDSSSTRAMFFGWVCWPLEETIELGQCCIYGCRAAASIHVEKKA